MTSFIFETHRLAYWTSVNLCFVLLAALCGCNGLPHHRTLRSASDVSDTSKQQGTTAASLGSLLDAGNSAIVTLVAGDTKLAAHRRVLAAGSPALAALFRPDTPSARSNQVNVPGIDGPVLRQLVEFLYTGRAPQRPSMALELLAAAEKYGVSALRDSIEPQVAENLSVENAAATAVLALKYNNHNLSQAAVAFIRDHLGVLVTNGWAEAVRSHPTEAVQIARLLKRTPAKTSATTAGSTSTSTAATPAAPKGCYNAKQPDAAAVAFFRSLTSEERNWRLLQAAEEDTLQGVSALLAAGAGVQARDRFKPGFTPLHWAARLGNMEVARCLLRAGAEVDARDTEYQQTPLHYAAGKGRTPMVRLLLEASADVGAANKNGVTALHAAAAYGHADAAALLLQAGADKGARDKDGDTALDLARRWNRQKVVQMLQ